MSMAMEDETKRLTAGYCLPALNTVGFRNGEEISELNSRGLLPHCIRFDACQSPGKRQCSFPARPLRLWRRGTFTLWVEIEGFAVSSTVPPSPRLAQRN